MRIYIIGNDGITLCASRRPHSMTARLRSLERGTARRALSGSGAALWKRFAQRRKRRKVGDHNALIDSCGRRSSGCRIRSRNPTRSAGRSRRR